MQWTVFGERQIYSCPWLGLYLSDVEVPGRGRYEHHVLKVRPSIGIAIVDRATDRVLMVWRHRITTDAWNWELPGGWVDEGEQPAHAAMREAEEETGWRPDKLREIAYIQPIAGIADAAQYVYLAEEATYTGPASDPFESEGVYWIPFADIQGMISRREIVGGVTVVALQQLLLDREAEVPGANRAPRSAA
ncbi:NUDIX hydrolase [Actinophytocola sediminis]